MAAIRTDGTELTELARGREETDPAWSPGGSQIAFISNRLTDDIWSGFQLVYKMNADGTNQTRLTKRKRPAVDSAPPSYDSFGAG